jgi:hypothetical protein
MLVKGEQLASHLTAIMESNSHPVVDVTGHFALLVRHLCDLELPE